MLCANPLEYIPPARQIAPSPEAAAPKAAVHVHGEPHYVTALCGPDAPERSELEQFIRGVFHHAYGASIKHFMPLLMSLRNADGKLCAVCGLRNAADNPLFLETYLDTPVETVISQRLQQPVARPDIVEIGNLAVAEPGIAAHLLASVSRYLHNTNTQWAVFTAIPVLKNSLARLNMQLEVLAPANIDRISPDEQPGWGSYYDKNPQVMAVRRATRPDYSQRSLVV